MSIWDSTPSWAQGEPVQNETENMQTGTENVEQTETGNRPRARRATCGGDGRTAGRSQRGDRGTNPRPWVGKT